MGRPPMGKVAMTGAERVRRFRLKHATDKPVTKHVTKQTDDAQGKELARARARIAELERKATADKARIVEQAAEIARLRKTASTRKPATKPANPDDELARAKATIVDLRRGLRYFQKRPEGRIDERTFTLIRGRMHPDRVSDPEQKARYKTAFEVFGDLKKGVVDKDQLPLTTEGWDAMRRKKPEAKKRQPAASPRPPRGLPKS